MRFFEVVALETKHCWPDEGFEHVKGCAVIRGGQTSGCSEHVSKRWNTLFQSFLHFTSPPNDLPVGVEVTETEDSN